MHQCAQESRGKEPLESYGLIAFFEKFGSHGWGLIRRNMLGRVDTALPEEAGLPSMKDWCVCEGVGRWA